VASDLLVGRRVELAALRDARARGARVVTIVGLGGVGKTHLANVFAAGVDEVLRADAAGARTRVELCGILARALDVRADESPESFERRVGDRLAQRGRVLVVVDNFEQLETGASELVEAWALAAPHATLLVTSRRPLEIPSESVIRLEPLSLPTEAAELFLARASSRVHGALGEADRALVDDVVRRLDGIPLAIELAAARLDVLPLDALAARLAERFALLRNPLAMTERHGTLLQALEWSWELLEPWQRTALARLSLFEAPFRIDDAEAVLDPETALDAVHALVRHSLARSTPSGEISLLDTVRAWAATKLDPNDDARARHARHFLDRGLAALAAHEARGAFDPSLERARDDLSAIARRALARGDADEATRALVALGPLLAIRAPADERLARADEVLARAPLATEMALRLSHARALALRECGRPGEALAEIDRAVVVARSLGLRGVESMLHDEASAAENMHGAPERAAERSREAVSLAVAAAEPRREALARYRLAMAEVDCGRFESGAEEGRRALAIFRAIGDSVGEVNAHVALGACAFEQADLDVAEAHMKRAEELARRGGERRSEAVAVGYLGGIAHEREQWDLAHDEYARARDTFVRIAHRRLAAIYAGYVGIVDAQRGDLDAGEPAIERARDVLGEIGDARYRAAMSAALVGVRALRGETNGAFEELDRIQASVVGHGSAHLATVVEVYRGVVEAALGDVASAERRAAAHTRALTEDTRLALPFLRRAIREAKDRVAAWTFDARGVAFRAPGEETVRLDTREPLARIVAALVRRRLDRPDVALARDELVAAGWPDEARMSADSAKNRLKVAVSTLRKAGLERVLVTRGSGYLLDPRVPIRLGAI